MSKSQVALVELKYRNMVHRTRDSSVLVTESVEELRYSSGFSDRYDLSVGSCGDMVTEEEFLDSLNDVSSFVMPFVDLNLSLEPVNHHEIIENRS